MNQDLFQLKHWTFKLNPIEGLLLAFLLATNLISAHLAGTFDPIGLFTSVTGIMCVILISKGHIANYLFGVINVSLYAFVAFKSKYWGEVMLNLIYYLPMQFVGIMFWLRNLKSDSNGIITSNTLSWKQRLGVLSVVVAGIFIYRIVLQQLNGREPLLDATTTVLSIVAMYMVVKRYSEQWWLWIVVNCATIILWTKALLHGEEHAGAMIAMWSAYLLNSIYGVWSWKLLSDENEQSH